MNKYDSIKKVSKFLSYILRHHPESIGLELDKHGWAHLPTLIQKAKKHGRIFTREQVTEVIHSSSKQRFSISGDGAFIRAGYGHSIPVDLTLEPKSPPEILYHGTARKNIDSILNEGLHAGNRNFVHLSAKKEDAISVGQRHGNPVVLQIEALKMSHKGFAFYQSESEENIWLTQRVAPPFITS